MGSANERKRYFVMPPLTGWAHAQNDPWFSEGKCDIFTHVCQSHFTDTGASQDRCSTIEFTLEIWVLSDVTKP